MTSVRDIILITIILFILGIAAMFMVNINHKINTKLLSISTFSNNTAATNVITKADTAQNSLDYIYLAIFIGFFISIIVFGWLVGGLPIFAPIYFFLIMIFSFIGVILQLVWIEIGSNSTIIATTSQLPITNFILLHLGYFTVAMGLVGLVVMFAKPQDNAGVY